MELVNEPKDILVAGLTPTAFTIEKADMPLIIELVGSLLYSSKVRAAMTELSSNAYDAHIAAGKGETPFDIHLPTRLNPIFRIVDYGVSMSPAQVTGVYGLVGRSTKRNTNEQIGCFGIGKLSVLAVTDSYFLICGKDGVKTTYNVYKDDTNMPQFAKVIEEPTDWTGVEVNFGVKLEDISDFYEAAREIFKFYSIKPNIICDTPVTFTKPNYRFEGDNWGVSFESESLAIMGQTFYPIKPDAIKDPERGELFKALLESGVHLFMDLGDVSVSPTREQLTYTNKTVNKIKEMLSIVLDEIATAFSKAIEDCPNIWEAKKLRYSILQDASSTFYGLRAAIGEQAVFWRGIEITNNYFDFEHVSPSEAIITSYAVNPKRIRLVSSRAQGLTCSNKNIVVFDDMTHEDDKTRRIHWRLRPLLEKPTGEKTENGKDINHSVCVFRFASAEARETFMRDYNFETVPFITLSSLPAIKPVTVYAGLGGGSNPRYSKQFFVYDTTKAIKPSGYWNYEDFDIDPEKEGGLYVVIDKYFINSPKTSKLSPSYLTHYIEKLKSLGIEVPEVYGIKRKYVNSNTLNSNWVNFWEYAKAKIAEKITPDVVQKLVDRAHAKNLSPYWLNLLNSERKIEDPENPILAFQKERVELLHTQEKENLSQLADVATYFLVPMNKELFKPVKELSAPNIEARYPLFNLFDRSYVSNSCYPEKTAAIIDYINTVDKNLKNP